MMMMMMKFFVCEKEVCLLCAGRKCEIFRKRGCENEVDRIFVFLVIFSPSECCIGIFQSLLLGFVQVSNGTTKACG
jgi:hypothetical protein